MPDVHPAAEVQRRLDEIKAQSGKTLTNAEVGQRVCFATEQERQRWIEQNGQQEYRRWLESQPGYQEYLKSRPTARTSETDTTAAASQPDTIQSEMFATLYDNAGYGGYGAAFWFPEGCSPGSGWGVSWVGSDINDTTSSSKFTAGSNCRFWDYYWDANFGGPHEQCYDYGGDGSRNCYYVGDSANDKTSSFSFTN